MGWLELGNPEESVAELRRVSPGRAEHPHVLEMWFALHSHRGDWPEALKVAEALVKRAPKRASGWLHRAYAIRRVPQGGLQAAWDALLPARAKFPKVATIPYNLACYACQLGRVEEAWEWFRKAYAIARVEDQDRRVQMALADADLAPLRQRIQEKYDDVPF